MNRQTAFLAVLCALLALAIASSAPLNGGDADCSGTNNVSDLTYMVDYLFKGGPEPCAIGALGTPIAAGIISPTGGIQNGTGNFTCTWNAAQTRYEITIDGETYSYESYLTHVTPLTTRASPNTGSTSGKLAVQMYDISGTYTTGWFAFTTYKLAAKSAVPGPPADDLQPEPR